MSLLQKQAFADANGESQEARDEATVTRATRVLQLAVVALLVFFHFELFSNGMLCRATREALLHLL